MGTIGQAPAAPLIPVLLGKREGIGWVPAHTQSPWQQLLQPPRLAGLPGLPELP